MDYNGYILTVQPPATRREVIRAFEQTGGLYVSEVSYVVGKARLGEPLGLMPAPSVARSEDYCFIRCAATALARAAKLYRQMGRDGWPQSPCFAHLRDRCLEDRELLATCSGNVLAMARVEGQPRRIDGRWYARLAEPQLVNGGQGALVRSLPPHGRSVSTRGATTMLKPEETALLIEALGLSAQG